MPKNDILQKAEEYMKLKYRFELTEDEADAKSRRIHEIKIQI